MGFSNYLISKIINHTVNNTPFIPQPTAVYLALLTNLVGDVGTEVLTSGTGYARQLVTFTASSNGSLLELIYIPITFTADSFSSIPLFKVAGAYVPLGSLAVFPVKPTNLLIFLMTNNSTVDRKSM